MKINLPVNPPEDLKEAWPGQFRIFPWISFVTNMPSPVFIVTTLKENGLANAQLNCWGMMAGSGAEPKFLLQVMKSSDTYKLIQKNWEFVINIPSFDVKDLASKTIEHYDADTDEIIASGMTMEGSDKVAVPRIKECFAHYECIAEWVRDIEENDAVNALIQAKIVSASIDEACVGDDIRTVYGKRNIYYFVYEMCDPVKKVCYATGAFSKLDIDNLVNQG